MRGFLELDRELVNGEQPLWSCIVRVLCETGLLSMSLC